MPTFTQPRTAAIMPDFLYDDEHLVVYVDGPAHDFPDRQRRDEDQTQALRAGGWSVMRFRHDDDWAGLVASRPDVFGEGI